MGRLHSRFLVVISLQVLLLQACATAKPRGQVVRLQADFQENGETIAKREENIQTLTQPQVSSLAVPAPNEDAAVFHFAMGQAYSLDNDSANAIESYRATLVHDPKSALVRARLAAELVKQGAFAEAKLLCLEAIRLDPKYVDSHILLAGIQVAAKEFTGAFETYQAALKVEPNNRDALLYLGITLAEVGRIPEGVAQLEKLVKLKDSGESNIDRSVAYYYLAKVYDQADKRDAAAGALRSALKERPGFAKAALALAEFHLEKKDEAGALKVLEEAFRENHSAELAARLATVFLDRKEYQRAVSYLETLVEEDPANENMKLRLALVYWQLQWTDKAHRLLSAMLDQYPASSEIAFYLAELEMKRENFDAALGYYNRIASDYAKYEQVVGAVAHFYREKKRYVDGENYLLEAMRKRPDAVAFYPLLAALHEDQGKLENAKVALERGERAFPQDESILYYLGFLYDRLGDHGKAVATMERLLETNPGNANALNFVGYTLLERGGDRARAATLLKAAYALKPQDPFVLDSYGWLLYRQGQGREAMKTLERAHAMRPDEGVIAEHLADIYLSLDLRQKAVATYERARKNGGDQEFVARVEQKLQNLQRVLAEGGVSKPVGTRRRPASNAQR